MKPHPASLGDPVALLHGALRLGTGDTPFPWQQRLLDRFRSGAIPRSLDVPTGLGKTATIALWLLARALGAPVPRRLAYIVDRRAVVDQATAEAEELRGWAEQTPGMAEALGLGKRRLAISTLRGQHADNREWLEDPAAPAIVVGTVDMIGSRLLFCGYATSRKMRPYHAGLLGHDTLFVLDEAHLVPPFERLLEAVVGDREPLGPDPELDLPQLPAPCLLSLSATGRSQGVNAFDLDEQDLTHPEVHRRLRAIKRIQVQHLDHDDDVAIHAAERAWTLTEGGKLPRRVIVFLNRRADAEAALGHVASLAGLTGRRRKAEPTADVELLVGARRVFERVEAAARLRSLGFLAGSMSTLTRPAFLFATSAGEVGVDLDADLMVSDLVAWERMVQRLGRVNRRGRGAAVVHVFAAPPDAKAPEAVRERLHAAAALIAQLPDAGGGAHDGSPGALREIQRAARSDTKLGALVTAATTPDPFYPPLDRPTLEAWSMTSLSVHAGRPAVAPWLRGWIEARPQTTLVWRRYLPPDLAGQRGRSLRRFLQAAPPELNEKLETEAARAADWLLKRAKTLLKRAAKAPKPAASRPLTESVRVAVLMPADGEPKAWSLTELSSMTKTSLSHHLQHATVVLDARLAGLRHGLLDTSCDAPPATADGDHWLPRTDDDRPTVRFRVRDSASRDPISDPSWRERERFPLQRTADGEVTRWLVVDKWRHDAATEEDRSAGRPQRLAEHQAWAEERARSLAERLDLDPDLTEVLAAAAALHDEGKRAPRWQAAMHAPRNGTWAKTRGPVDVRLLDGYRHEFGSLPIAEGAERLVRLTPDARDLALHLIASHHGFARPTIRTTGCEDAPPSALARRERDVALRFARLQARWGPWGLAWLEAILRAADQQASRDNDVADDVLLEEV